MNTIDHISEPIMLPTGHGTWVHATMPAADNKFHSIMIYDQFAQGLVSPANKSLKDFLPDVTQPVLMRIHSSCRFGETFHGESCDCGPQLEGAMERIQQEGHGIILYMDQEGRGTDLLFKNKAVRLEQVEGLTTAHTFKALGLEHNDLRDYEPVLTILKGFDIAHIRLMTNNPKKLEPLQDAGFEVKREPLIMPHNKHSADYLESKRAEMDHMLPAPKPCNHGSTQTKTALGYIGAAAVITASLALTEPAAQLSAQSTFNGVAHLGGHVLHTIDWGQGLKNIFSLLTASVCGVAVLKHTQSQSSHCHAHHHQP